MGFTMSVKKRFIARPTVPLAGLKTIVGVATKESNLKNKFVYFWGRGRKPSLLD